MDAHIYIERKCIIKHAPSKEKLSIVNNNCGMQSDLHQIS